MNEGKVPDADNPTEHSRTNRRSRPRVKLFPPWGAVQKDPQDGEQERLIQQTTQMMDDAPPEVITAFVDERSRVHEVFIREQYKTKRIGLLLAFALIVLAAAIVMFAPEGRQTLSYWIGAALLIFAAGASGFGRVWGKTKSTSFGAGQDRRDPGK